MEVICSRSGLKFEADSRRQSVHPGIRYYTSHKDYNRVRYPAVEVIERGKKEGWTTIEKFEEEIQKALNPEPPVRPEYDFEGAWAAKIVGSDEKYRFNRLFLQEVDTEGRFKRYRFNYGDGIYECNYKSGKGNVTGYYYRVEGTQKVQIDFSEIEKLFPSVETIEDELQIEGAIKVKPKHRLGNPGEVVTHDEQLHTIVHIEINQYWEDDDGIIHKGEAIGDCVYAWRQWIYYLKPATEEEIARHNQQVEADRVRKEAQKAIAQIYNNISVENGAIAPKNSSYPSGKELVVRMGHHQPNDLLIITQDKVWGVTYNGRDGDDWRGNNIAGGWVGCWVPLTPELETQLNQIYEALSS